MILGTTRKYAIIFLILIFTFPVIAGHPFSNAATRAELNELRYGSPGKDYSLNVQTLNPEEVRFIRNILQDGLSITERANLFMQGLNADARQLNKPADNSNVLLEQVQEFFFFGEFKEKTNYSYDEAGNTIAILGQSWENSEYINSMREYYTFDGANNQIQMNSEIWDGTQWILNMKTDWSYDSENLMLNSYSYVWENEDWTPSGAWFFTYDSNGNLVEELSKMWTGLGYANSYKKISTFDDQHRLTSETHQFVNGIGLQNFWRYEYLYDSNGFQIAELDYTWDASEWWMDHRSTMVNDSLGNMIEILEEFSNGADWINSYRADLTYNEYNNQTGATGYSWTGSDWFHMVTIEMQYDEFQNQTLYTMNADYDGNGIRLVNRISRTFGVFSGIGDLRNRVPAGIELAQNYPNPFNPATTIEFTIPEQELVNLEVFDLQGRKVATVVSENMAAGTYSVPFTAKNMASGIYLYRLRAGGTVLTKKFTLLK